MSPDLLHALAVIVGAIPTVIISAIGATLAALLVAAAFAEVIISRAESAPASSSTLDDLDGLGR